MKQTNKSVILDMQKACGLRDIIIPEGHGLWAIFEINTECKVTFPDDAEILELWREKVPGGGELIIHQRTEKRLLVSFPLRLQITRQRRRFVVLLAQRCVTYE